MTPNKQMQSYAAKAAPRLVA